MTSSSTPSRTALSRLRSLGSKNVLWLTSLLCIGSIIGNVALLLSNQDVPLVLLVLNLLTFASLWLVRQCADRTIHLEPHELAARMLQVQESERHRLSRELHDDIGQMLTAARLQLDWLQRRLPAELHDHGHKLNLTLDETLEKVRDLSAILNPRQLSSLGLEASLRSHLMRTLADSQVRWSFECNQRLDGISEALAVAAFRITQEAVTNMLRHAQARNLLVRVQRLPEGLSLLIQDDGLGFDPARNPAHAAQGGLAGMSERVAMLEGRWQLLSTLGAGTRIDVLFPWVPRDQARAHPNKT